MRSLRILHVTPYFKDAWAYGGIPRLAHALTRGLARRGHSVTVCTTDVCDERSRLPRQKSQETARMRFDAWSSTTPDGVGIRVFPNLSNRLAYHLQFFVPLGLDRYMSAHAASFDVAHLHACRNLPGVIAARHLRAAGVPYVLAPNGTAPRIERRRLAKAAFDVVAGRRVLAGAARLLAVTEAERAQLVELGVRQPAIDVIPNPIDLDEFSIRVEPGVFRRRIGVNGTPIVLFLGKLTPRKRLDVLVRAFARLRRPDARLVVAGNDMGAGAASRALSDALDLNGRAIFTGLLRDRERLEALADADVLVYPSQDEIFGLVPLESLLSGTPVVVAGDSGCGEVVHATGGGAVVPAGDVDALTAAIDAVLDAPARWKAAASAAAGRVRAAYGSDAVCSQLEHLYSKILGPPEGGHYVR